MNKNLWNNTIEILGMVGRLDVLVSSLTIFGIFCIAIWGVTARYILGQPAGWVGELSLIMFIWLTFFGMSILARRGELVNIEFLLKFFPDKTSFFVKRIFSTVLLVICLTVIIYLGFKLTFFSHNRYTASLRIPYSYVYLGIPLGSLFTLFHALCYAFRGPQYLEEVETML